MFSLYHNREKHELVIKPAKLNQLMIILDKPEEVVYYNYCFFVSNNRKALKKKADEMKNTWVTELEEELKAIKAMKITTKY